MTVRCVAWVSVAVLFQVEGWGKEKEKGKEGEAGKKDQGMVKWSSSFETLLTHSLLSPFYLSFTSTFVSALPSILRDPNAIVHDPLPFPPLPIPDRSLQLPNHRHASTVPCNSSSAVSTSVLFPFLPPTAAPPPPTLPSNSTKKI